MRLRDIAYYRTGGRCAAFYQPRTVEDLSRIVTALHATQQKYFVLGSGTNSLVLDEDWPGGVISFKSMTAISQVGNTLNCEAGAENTAIAQTALQSELAGVAWMNRLPGQLGGTVRMNARCYGGEISQVVREVTAVLPDGTIKVYHPQDSVFRGYKDTLFMRNGAIIASAQLELSPGDAKLIAQQMKYCEDDRISKGQFHFPTCGCVFKNDYSVGVPSGMLLDKAGAHKLNLEKVALNPKHANFVYNRGASSREILEMTLKMRELVYHEFGVWLEYEMEILGQLPPDLAQRVNEQRPSKPIQEKILPLKATFQNK